MKKKILAFLLMICLIVPCAFGLVSCKKNEEPAVKTMTTSFNPEITFMLDKNNKITSVSYGNSDAGTVFANVNFVGKDASSAIQIVIEQSAISGHVTLSGEEVNFEFTGEDIKSLQEIAEQKTKEIFENLGVEVSIKISDASKSVKRSALIGTAQVLAPELGKNEISDMTDAELIELINKKQKDFKDLAFDQIDDVQNGFDKLVLSAIETLRSTIESLEATIEEYGDLIPAEIKKQYNDAKKQLQDKIDEFLNERKEDIKKAKKVAEDHKKALIATYKAEIATKEESFKEHLNTAKANGKISEEQFAYWTNLLERNK